MLLLLCLIPLTLSAADLTIHVSGFNSNDGRLRFSMFDEAGKNNFPMQSSKAQYISEAEIINGKANISLKAIKPGSYAIFVYHDSNNNNKLDHKWYGPPKESLGYFREYKLKMMPPDFEDVMFELINSNIKMNIVLQTF